MQEIVSKSKCINMNPILPLVKQFHKSQKNIFHFRIDWKRAFAKSQLFKFSI